ncbi:MULTISPECIES: heparinase II/III family protein [Gluconobacter]|uniref:Heparinase n=1 Tax=Gluconobacter cadivus TaxID=2728101 RepID=A0ABR9YSM7_9PROT|nr:MULTISPECIES: heparinase II/III family protein [Gluconobacter]MBF0887319.1 heparinase [Gluconobacter cadivus]MBS1059388.1 heparinase II/III family protein [Gluconobacter sp. Dm-44]
MTGSPWLRGLRLSLARLPFGAPAPEGPVHVFRDPWKGDAEQGARLIGGKFRFDRHDYVLPSGNWERGPWPEPAREWLHGFGWLRDLRTLGSDRARLTARGLVSDWLAHPPTDPLVRDACVTGSRLASWLSNHEFCLASADPRLQQRLMERMLVEGRTIAALLPLPPQGARGLMAFRGLLAAAMAMPEQTGFMSRFLRYLPAELERLVLADGTVIERSPEAQFLVARELAEMSVMFRTAHASVPPFIDRALDKVCPVLRAMRHGDGGLAVFNGANERHSAAVEDVLAQGSRQKLIAPAMPQGRFTRLALGKSLLIVDSGPPAQAGFDTTAHAGTLSFEFSHQRHRLFVNCGSAVIGAWREAMRSSAAHTVLVADGLSSADFGPDGGMTRRPVTVSCDHQTDGNAHWLDLSHDGYHAPLGAKWTRRLYFGADGEDLRGQELIDGERNIDFAIRFHIHPDVTVTQDDEDIILQVGGTIWRFRQRDGVVRLENDVYLGRGKREICRQIIITPQPVAEVAALSEGESAPEPEKPAAQKPVKRTHQSVTWLLERIPE